MSIQEFIDQFIQGIRQTSLLEFVAVLAGIVSVWFSKRTYTGISHWIDQYLDLHLSKHKRPTIRRSQCECLLFIHEHLWLVSLD